MSKLEPDVESRWTVHSDAEANRWKSPVLDSAEVGELYREFRDRLRREGAWERVKRALKETVQPASALEMADELVALEERSGFSRAAFNSVAEQLAAELELSWSAVRQRLWVGREFPPEHPVRSHGLGFAHLRALVGSGRPEYWAERSRSERWTVRMLKRELASAGEGFGRECSRCEQQQPAPDGPVVIRIQQEAPRWCCSTACARRILGG